MDIVIVLNALEQLAIHAPKAFLINLAMLQMHADILVSIALDNGLKENIREFTEIHKLLML